MTRVLLLSRYGRLGASSRIRHHDLVPALEAKGFRFDTVPLLSDAYLRRFYAGQRTAYAEIANGYLARAGAALRARGHDLIWIEKEAFPWLPWTLESAFFRERGPAVVLDFDDFWPSRYMESAHPAARRIGRVKFAHALARADIVTVANERLAALLRPLAPAARIEVIENGIDFERYSAAGQAVTHPSGGPLRVGWIGTPYTAGAYLPAIGPTLNRLSREGVIRLMLIGAGDSAPDIEAERADWSESAEADLVAGNEVGLMPLAGSAFDAGKSGWKLVQFMAAGRAVVASPIGFNLDIVQHEVTGLQADSPQGFEEALRRLASDVDLRRSMGEAGQRLIARRFARTLAADKTAQAFHRALAWRAAHRRT